MLPTYIRDKLDQPAIAMLEQCPIRDVAAETIIMHPGDHCDSYAWLLEGQIKLSMYSESGREILLYRILPGEACVLSTACLFSNDQFPAEASVEQDCRILMIPIDNFRRLVNESEGFRQFVFTGFTERLSQLMLVIDRLTFTDIEHRLINFLLAEAKDNVLAATHETIAKEIGTVREVVSRHLKRFEKQGWIQLSRGSLTILNREALSLCDR